MTATGVVVTRPPEADSDTIQRVATARASKAVRLYVTLIGTDNTNVTSEGIDRLTVRQRALVAQRAGVREASPMTWDVVKALAGQVAGS